MHPSSYPHTPLSSLHKGMLAAGLLSMLAACGGGGGSSPNTDQPAAPSTTAVSTTVIDGPLQNAVVCLDKNSNGACDEGEPSGKTDASGKATVDVDNADLGRFPILAIVGTDALDADTGAVPVPYTLRAPADQTGVVSPLTTMVQAYLETTGSSSADAAAAIQAQLGLGISPLSNFVQDSSADSKLAGTLARLIVVAKQEQRQDTEGALDANGKALKAAQIEAAIDSRMLQLLQTLSTAVLDNPTLQDTSTSIADKQTAIQTAARRVADASGLTADNIGTVIAAQTSPAAAETNAGATASLRWFTFTDTNNYFLRGFEATAQQNTPDANGKRYYTEFRETVQNGTETPWVRQQVYWTGTEWFACPTDFVQELTAIAGTGETESLYCKAMRSRFKQTARDISGLSIRSTVQDIRAYPFPDSAHGSYANWGPDPSLIPQSATWPAGSVLSYRSVNDLGNTEYYTQNNANRATIPPANDPLTLNMNLWRPATLDEFLAWNTGDFTRDIAEVHGNNSRVLVTRRDYVKPNGDPAYKRYMVGFETGGQKRARFYECEGNTATPPPSGTTLFINGVSTCKTILESTYVVSTQGDAKVLRFATEPTQLNTSNTQNYRLFIERGGVTYTGYRDKPLASYQQRLNLPAAQALLATVGLD